MSHKKFVPDRFSRFDVYWIQTNKETKPNVYIDVKWILWYRSLKAVTTTYDRLYPAEESDSKVVVIYMHQKKSNDLKPLPLAKNSGQIGHENL